MFKKIRPLHLLLIGLLFIAIAYFWYKAEQNKSNVINDDEPEETEMTDNEPEEIKPTKSKPEEIKPDEMKSGNDANVT